MPGAYNPRPIASESRYTWRGDEYRVIVVGDVVSIPGYAGSPGWSMGGFGGSSISVEWLLHDGRLPGSKAKKVALAQMIQDALADAHRSPSADRDASPPPPRAA